MEATQERINKLQKIVSELNDSSDECFLAAAEIEILRLRAIFPKIIEALGNGSACSELSSIEFLECLPEEVKLCILRLKNKKSGC